MDVSLPFFYFFAVPAIGLSLFVVLNKSPVSSAFALVLVFFCFAGIYALLGAHLVAALQVLVYAGAIMVLFVFVIMLLNADVPSFDLKRTPVLVKGGVVFLGAASLAGLVWVFKRSAFPVSGVPLEADNTRALSRLMFSDYVLPFELTSILILVGIVGCVAIAKRKKGSRHAS